MRLRWIAAAIVAVLVALLAALAIHVHSLLQPERFTALLQGDLSSVGLTLKLQAPAEPMLFPHPGVRLQGVTLGNTGAAAPLLRAESATIVVPWRALLYSVPAIERVDIDAPQLDLDELKALLARLPHRAGPPRLPTIATGVHLRQGTLAARGSPLLFGVSVNTGPLAPGQPFRLQAAARDASGRRFTGSLATVPAPPQAGAIEFGDIHLNLAEQDGPELHLQGTGTWRGGEDFALQLEGELRNARLLPAPAASSGAAPAGSAAAAAGPPPAAKVALSVVPRHGSTPMTVALKLDGADAKLDMHLQPAAFGAWWASLWEPGAASSRVPMPVSGTASVKQVELGWMQASGIEITASPAPAGTAPAPAASTATMH